MSSDTQWDALNQAFGYEVAVLLMAQSMSRSELFSEMPYGNFHKNQLERVIDRFLKEDLIKVLGERGPDKFKIKIDQFSESELTKVKERASIRLQDPAEEHGDTPDWAEMSDKFTSGLKKENLGIEDHANTAYTDSRFL